jgi:hypothetical protein
MLPPEKETKGLLAEEPNEAKMFLGKSQGPQTQSRPKRRAGNPCRKTLFFKVDETWCEEVRRNSGCLLYVKGALLLGLGTKLANL